MPYKSKFKRNEIYWKRDIRKLNCTPDQYIELMFKCGALCSICEKPESQLTKTGIIKLLAVDHCHKTGKLRGLLCSRCNLALGLLNDSSDILYKAISYLDKSNLS